MSEANMNKFLSIDEMLSTDDVTYLEYPVWGGKIRLGTLDAGTMLDFMEQNEGPGKKTAGIRLIIKSLVDKDGNRIGNMSMMEGFKKKNASVLNAIVDAILTLNGLGKKGLDISAQITACGLDQTKLAELSDDLRQLAAQLDEAGTDLKKLQAIQVLDRSAARTEAKNA